MIFYFQLSFIFIQTTSLLLIGMGYQLLGYSLFIFTLPFEVIILSINKKITQDQNKYCKNLSSREAFAHKKVQELSTRHLEVIQSQESLKNTISFQRALLKTQEVKNASLAGKIAQLQSIKETLVNFHLQQEKDSRVLNQKALKHKTIARNFRKESELKKKDVEFLKHRIKFYTHLLFRASSIIKSQRQQLQKGSSVPSHIRAA